MSDRKLRWLRLFLPAHPQMPPATLSPQTGRSFLPAPALKQDESTSSWQTERPTSTEGSHSSTSSSGGGEGGGRSAGEGRTKDREQLCCCWGTSVTSHLGGTLRRKGLGRDVQVGPVKRSFLLTQTLRGAARVWSPGQEVVVLQDLQGSDPASP